jgi:hypothetical protein
MGRRRSSALVAVAALAACAAPPAPAPMRAALVASDDASEARLDALARERFDTVVLVLDSERDAAPAAARVRARGLRLGWWVEVARCPQLADAQPDLMASLQGHDDWRREHPHAPRPAAGEVVKAWPWVPVGSREGFAAQRARVLALLATVPPGDLVFLSGLQAAPSACGCGSLLCRWTSDYGPIRTNTPLGDDAAARFGAEIQRAIAPSRVVPVWVSECEPADPSCGSVPCFEGACWKAFRRQWQPLVERCEQIAVLLSARAFGRDREWPGRALALLRQQTAASPAQACIPVIDAGTAGIAAEGSLTAFVALDQSFVPQVQAARRR